MHGVLDGFPWTRFQLAIRSLRGQGVLLSPPLVPFTGLGYETAARIVGTVGGATVLITMFLILRAEKVKFSGLWTLLPLGTVIFLYRFSQVRPHLFSIALAMMLTWAYCRRKLLLLFLAALLYPLCYVAFWQIPLLLLVAAEVGRLITGERFRWQPPLLMAVGLAAGVALHPNALNLLQMNWIHMTDILFRNAWGKHVEFNMGEEFEPFSISGWLRDMMAPTLAIAASLLLHWKNRQNCIITTTFTIVMLIFLLLTLRTNRFLEYLVPIAVLALAMTTRRRSMTWLLPAMVAVSLCSILLTGTPLLQYMFSPQQRPWQMDRNVISTFAKEIPVGANVFTCGWEYTGTLMAELPDRNYMVALDPTLLYKRDPALYHLWYRTLKDAPSTSAEIVRRDFASDYAVCLDHSTLHPFFDVLAADKGTRVLYSDGKWVLFDLGNGKLNH